MSILFVGGPLDGSSMTVNDGAELPHKYRWLLPKKLDINIIWTEAEAAAMTPIPESKVALYRLNGWSKDNSRVDHYTYEFGGWE